MLLIIIISVDKDSQVLYIRMIMDQEYNNSYQKDLNLFIFTNH